MTPFDWDEFLEFAEEQVRRRGHPAAERSAISRAYYAAFHRARSHYADRGERLTFRADEHGIVPEWFRSQADQRLRMIGAGLVWLRQLRRDADYGDRFPNLTTEAEAAVRLARRLLNQIADVT